MSKSPSRADLLLSISVAQRWVSEYLEHLGPIRPGPDRPTIGPLDSLLLPLSLEFLGPRIDVLDLASGPTLGLSTILAATRENVRTVWIPEPSPQSEGWYQSLSEFLDDRGPRASCPIKVESSRPTATPSGARRVVIAALRDQQNGPIAREVDRLLPAGQGTPVLFLGLGQTGACPVISELVRRSAADGSGRLFLFRELTGVLGESQIGLFAPDPEAQALPLQRINAYFHGNFDFARMVEGICRAAVAATQLDETTRKKLLAGSNRQGIDSDRLVRELLKATQERDSLQQDVENLLGLVWSLQQQRDELEQMLGGRLIAEPAADDDATATATVDELSIQKLPGGLIVADRHPLVIRMTKVWRQDGVGGVLRRISTRAKAAARPRRARNAS